MSRTKGAKDKEKRTRTSKDMPPSGVFGDSLSSKKANNQILKATGMRKCKVCGKLLKLVDFNITGYRRRSPKDDTVVPVYSMTCLTCEHKSKYLEEVVDVKRSKEELKARRQLNEELAKKNMKLCRVCGRPYLLTALDNNSVCGDCRERRRVFTMGAEAYPQPTIDK